MCLCQQACVCVVFGIQGSWRTSDLRYADLTCWFAVCAVQGFYGVYSNVFSMLAEQELAAWQQTEAAGAPDATPPKFAPFGTSDSPSADVFAFYSNWGSFVTCKEFAWADKYNPAAAPNRQVWIIGEQLPAAAAAAGPGQGQSPTLSQFCLAGASLRDNLGSKQYAHDP